MGTSPWGCLQHVPRTCAADSGTACVQDARCIFAIHNLSHQGVEPASTYANFGLPDDWCAAHATCLSPPKALMCLNHRLPACCCLPQLAVRILQEAVRRGTPQALQFAETA